MKLKFFISNAFVNPKKLAFLGNPAAVVILDNDVSLLFSSFLFYKIFFYRQIYQMKINWQLLGNLICHKRHSFPKFSMKINFLFDGFPP